MTNLNMQNSMVMFTFSVLDRKKPFWGNLIREIKIVSLKLVSAIFSQIFIFHQMIGLQKL